MVKKELKNRASFTFDKETILILEELSNISKYRNKSHVVEEAIKLLKKQELNDNSDKLQNE